MELTLACKKPLPYGQHLKALGRITKDTRLLFEAEGEIYTPEGEGAVTAKARYVKMSIGQISDDFDPDSRAWQVHLHIDGPMEI